MCSPEPAGKPRNLNRRSCRLRYGRIIQMALMVGTLARRLRLGRLSVSFGCLEMWRTCGMIATLLPMLFHSIFGCCWHHAHCVGQVSTDSVAVESNCDHHNASRSTCPRHGESKYSVAVSPADSPPANESESPNNDGHPCDENRCVFLPCETQRQDSALEIGRLVLAVDFRPSRVSNLPCEVPLFPAPLSELTSFVSLRAMTQVWIV